MQRPALIIGLLIMVAAIVFGVIVFKGSLINTVNYADATAATDSTVQIMGAPVPGTLEIDPTYHYMHFRITDGNGDTMHIVYSGPKPEDLDTAMSKGAQITVQGTYDPNQHEFDAQTLLVKCPSKYQGGAPAVRTYNADKT